MEIDKMYFEYGDAEIKHLSQSDKQLGSAISKIGKIERAVEPDMFASLVRSIVGQQISTKAQRTVWGRMIERLSEITPSNVNELSVEEIQKFGISFRKASYIKGSAEKVCSGSLNLDELHSLPDSEVIAQLTRLDGVGVWTAEMLMIFSMLRPDVISYGDLAIRRGMCMLYGYESIDKKTFEMHRRSYSPYGSVASLYLWAVSAGALDD